jgi:uncharacterized protein (DUF58 family)
MKLAELCTAFPEKADAQTVRRPGTAIPATLRLKLRAQRGHLQAALDHHPQRSPDRLGLGLRPYEAGDPLRTIALRPLVLQEQLLTRTDSSKGRFHVTVVVHSYAHMNFKSDSNLPSKNQLAWAVAGLLQNLHEQSAQRVDILVIGDRSLPEGLLRHAAALRRSHFCYVVTDLLFDASARGAAVDSVISALNFIHLRKGMFIVVRDPLESPDSRQLQSTLDKTLSLLPPDGQSFEKTESTANHEHQSGPLYAENLRIQLADLSVQLSKTGWSSLLATADDDIDQLVRHIAVRHDNRRTQP